MEFLWQRYAFAAVLAFVGWSAAAFVRNLCLARRTGLPVLISPVSRMNFIWVIIQEPVQPLLKRLPFGLGSFNRFATLTWWFKDRYRLHEEYGKVFLIVSPGALELISADPEVTNQIYAKRFEIDKTTDLLEKSKLSFGDSLTSVIGSDWVRHRRAVITSFHERNNRIVWDEGVRQAIQVGAYFRNHGAAGCSTTTHDWLTVALNVLVAGALGESWEFRPRRRHNSAATVTTTRNSYTDDTNSKVAKSKAAYHEALGVLCGSLLLYSLTPFWIFSVPPSCLPSPLRGFVAASNTFKKSMDHMIQDVKDRIAAGNASNDSTFLTNLILRSEEMRTGTDGKTDDGFAIEGTASRGGLSQEEVYGNIFLFNLAGHETTASTLGYAVYLLAAHPEWQEWLWQELDRVYPDRNSVAHLGYSNTYPQLKRVYALMYETLRLYGPIHVIYKTVCVPHDVELSVNDHPVMLPYHTYVLTNLIAMHTLPEYWGKDHLEWKPERWIDHHGPSREETIRDPPSGKDTFFPWSRGGRGCPGKKFSQVEFVAIVSVLCRQYRIEVVPKQGETPEQARMRCRAVIEDSQTEITLRMNDPWSVNLRFVERQ